MEHGLAAADLCMSTRMGEVTYSNDRVCDLLDICFSFLLVSQALEYLFEDGEVIRGVDLHGAAESLLRLL